MKCKTKPNQLTNKIKERKITILSHEQIKKLRSLDVPHTFKSYKELCNYLGLKNVSGNSRISQFKTLGRYVELKKAGHKIIVESILEKALPENDLRKNRVYGDSFETIMIDNGKKIKNDERNPLEARALVIETGVTETRANKYIHKSIYISPRQLMLGLNMINKNYIEAMYDPKYIADYFNLDQKKVKEFFMNTSSNFTSIINLTLDKLEKRALARGIKTKIIIRKDSTHEPATSKEEDIILVAQRKVLDKMGLETISQAVMDGKMKELVDQSCESLRQEEWDIVSYYTVYEIRYTNKIEEEDLAEKIIEKIIFDANKIIQKRIIRNAKNRHTKQKKKLLDQIEEYSFIVEEDRFKDFRAEDEYVDEYEKMVRLFIDKDAEDKSKTISDYISYKKRLEKEK